MRLILLLIGSAAIALGINGQANARAECRRTIAGIQERNSFSQLSKSAPDVGILRSHVTLAEVNLHYWQRQFLPYAMKPATAPAALLDSIRVARTKLDEATAAYRRAIGSDEPTREDWILQHTRIGH